MLAALDRGWSREAPTQPPSCPVLLFSLASAEELLKAAYKLVTEGKFADALRAFNRLLQVRWCVVLCCLLCVMRVMCDAHGQTECPALFSVQGRVMAAV